MRRHSIIARLGPADRARVEIHTAGSVATQVRFIDGERRFGYGIGQAIDRLTERGIIPSETAVDLMLLAAAANAADTRISRSTESQDSWTREIDLYIPVLDPARWSALAPLIVRTLNFLTGDRWDVFFRDRHRQYTELVRRPRELLPSPHTSVSLFSGGLDSFIGAIDLLAAGENPLFMSHYWDASTSSQEMCAHRIGAVYGDRAPARPGACRIPQRSGSRKRARKNYAWAVIPVLRACRARGERTRWRAGDLRSREWVDFSECPAGPASGRCMEHEDDSSFLHGPMAGAAGRARHSGLHREPLSL